MLLLEFGNHFLFALRAMRKTLGLRYSLRSWSQVLLHIVALEVMWIAALKRLPMILKLVRWNSMDFLCASASSIHRLDLLVIFGRTPIYAIRARPFHDLQGVSSILGAT